MIWLTNAHKDHLLETRKHIGWPVLISGEPKATEAHTSAELSRMGVIGLYRPDGAVTASPEHET
jgi:hypothetical protein